MSHTQITFYGPETPAPVREAAPGPMPEQLELPFSEASEARHHERV